MTYVQINISPSGIAEERGLGTRPFDCGLRIADFQKDGPAFDAVCGVRA